MSDDGFVGIGHNPNPNVPDIPEGFTAALTEDSSARICFQGLSDTQKTNVIKYIQSNNVLVTMRDIKLAAL